MTMFVSRTLAEARTVTTLARQFGRSRDNAPVMSVAAVVAAFVVFMYLALQAFSPSTDQALDRDFGRYAAFAGYGVVTGAPGDDQAARTLRPAQALVAGDSATMLIAADVETATPGGSTDLLLYETAWDSEPFPDVYELQTGRWASAPGEVVLTNSPAPQLKVGDTLPVLSDGARLKVVGTAVDKFNDYSSLLVGQGTWASLDPQLADQWPDLVATGVFYWDGSSRRAVLDAIARAASASGGSGRADQTRAAVRNSFDTRRGSVDDYASQWIRRSPAGYTVPSILLPLGGVALIFALRGRRAHKSIKTLQDVGVRRRVAVLGFSLSVAAWALLASLGGSLMGWGLGAIFYQAIELFRVPDSPALPAVTEPVTRTMVVVLVATAIGTGVLLRTHSAPRVAKRGSSTARPMSLRRVRLVLASALMLVAAHQALEVGGVNEAARFGAMFAALFAAVVALCVPEIVATAVARMPGNGVRATLARRKLAADNQRASIAVAFLAVTVGMSVGFVALLSTLISTVDADSYPDALPGQLVITDPASVSLPAPKQTLELVEGLQHFSRERPVPLSRLLTFVDGDATTIVTPETSIGTLLAAPSQGDVEALLGRRLNRQQSSALKHGGVLLWSDSAAASAGSTTSLMVSEGDRTTRTIDAVPTAVVDGPPVRWRDGDDGVTLTQTARALDLPVTEGAMIYTGLSNQQVTVAQDAVREAGLNPKSAVSYLKPPPAIPPTALYVTAIGLLVVALAISVMMARAQVRFLRQDLATMMSIGLPSRWGRHILLYQQGLLTALGVGLGLVIAVVPVVISTHVRTSLVLDLPWGQILVLTVSLLLATAIAVVASARAVAVRERVS